MEMIGKAVEFLEKYHDCIGVIHHSHTDDISSAALMAHTLMRKWEIPKAVIPSHPNIPLVTQELVSEIKSQNLKSLVFLDMPVYEDLTYLLPLLEDHKILVVDDHPIEMLVGNRKINYDLNKHGIVHVCPYMSEEELEPEKYRTSKLTYDIGSKITNITDLDWVAAVGLLGDHAEKYWEDFFGEVYSRYPSLILQVDSNGVSSKLKKITSMMHAAATFGYMGIRTALEAYLQTTDPLDLSEGRIPPARELMKMERMTEDMVDKLMSEMSERSKRFSEPNLVLYKIGRPYDVYDVQAAVATILHAADHSSPILVTRAEGDFTFLEFRTDGSINCREWAQSSVSGLNDANAGGHDYVAGGHVRTKEFGPFLQRVRNYLATARDSDYL